MTKKKASLLVLLLLLLIGGLGWFLISHTRTTIGSVEEPVPTPIAAPSSAPESVTLVVPAATPTPTPAVKAAPVAAAKPEATPRPAAPALPAPPPPPVEIHKELIPKDIEIVRVYYSQMITGPGSLVEFDINGSGFNAEFEKMIVVQSGSPRVDVKNLKLMTPNQIHGVLVVKSDTPTGAIFPQVLIQDKVVFSAPEPFACIRPGEVFNMIFTEMGENGRSGRFRVFTNLTQDMFNAFRVTPDTAGILVSDLTPQLPFIVDGTINIGGAQEGSSGIQIFIGEKIIWERPGLIRIVKPNLGQTGLIQQARAVDGFHRPGDKANFILYGSGFQAQDAGILEAVVDGLSVSGAVFSFRSPGRMDLTLPLPADAPENIYTLHIRQKDTDLITKERAFVVVGKNWLRRYAVDPAIHPGGTSVLRLEGRDLDSDFVKSLLTSVDTGELSVGAIGFVSAELATASLNAGASLAPGDYLIHLTFQGRPVMPLEGNVIRVLPTEK